MRKSMNRLQIGMKFSNVIAIGLALLAPGLALASVTTELDQLSTSGPAVQGLWSTNFADAKEKAQAENVPLLVLYGNKGCSSCTKAAWACNTPEFREWQARRQLYMVALDKDIQETNPSYPIKAWVKSPKTNIGAFPFAKIWWVKPDGKVSQYDWEVRLSLMPDRKGDSIQEQFMNSVEKYIVGWEPKKETSIGSFGDPDEAYDRLEAEAGTTNVIVRLVREKKYDLSATNATVVAVGPDGKTVLSSTPISWAKGQTNQTVSVKLPKGAFKANGDRATLYIRATDGTNVATNHITCVKAPNASSNPLWAGEDFDFGEWTMDLEGAKAKVRAKAPADAYTLVMVTGALWCPNCCRFEQNFLNLTNAAGEVMFAKWAKKNNVALVTLDVPYLDGRETATLLSRTAAAAYFTDQAETSTTVTKSGLGYLTRKMVDDETASAKLRENIRLVGTLTKDGGFNRIEDTEDSSAISERPRVPCFYLLRPDGTVAARLSRFSFPTTPYAADRKWFDNYLKRFDEMLAIAGKDVAGRKHADATEHENDCAGAGSVALESNGGVASNELCCADLRDTYRLVGLGGNAYQNVFVSGKGGASLTISFWEVKDGKASMIKNAYTSGKLEENKPIHLGNLFEKTGDYYVQVKAKNVGGMAGVNYLDAEFSPTNATPMNFIGYSISTSVTLLPLPAQATASAPLDSDQVTMRLSTNALYRIEGLSEAWVRGQDLLKPVSEAEGNVLYTWTGEDGQDVELTCTNDHATVKYQVWEPGSVSFDAPTEVTKKETDDVDVTFRREKGVSGDVTVRVSVNRELSTFYYDTADWGGETTNAYPRFTVNGIWGFTGTNLVWKDGTDLKEAVGRLKLASYETELYQIQDYFGPGDIVFDLTILGQTPAGDRTNVVERGRFTVHYTENQKPNAGKVAIVGADREWSKKMTVYARASEAVRVDLQRVDAYEGAVLCTVKPGDKALSFVGEACDEDFALGVMSWRNHDHALKSVVVTNLTAGKSSKLTLSPVRPLTAKSGANAVTIVAVRDDAAEFDAATPKVLTFYRYVSVSNAFPVIGAAEGSKLGFTKLSGSLPSGLSVKADDAAQAMIIQGIPSKAGFYEVTYQVVEKRPKEPGSKSTVSIPGLTATFAFTVVDPAAPGSAPDGGALNDSCAKARKFLDVPVVALYSDEGEDPYDALYGTLTLEVPAKGNLSAKLACSEGTFSFSSKSWNGLDLEGNTNLFSRLSCTKRGYPDQSIEVRANPDGSLDVLIASLSGEGVVHLTGETWSKDRTAEAYQGAYTVALPVRKVEGYPDIDEAEGAEGLAPNGQAYLTLKLEKSAYKTGKVTWKGQLPNGVAVSGSTTLFEAADEGLPRAWLPIFKQSKKDVFSAFPEVLRDAKKRADEKADEFCYRSVGLATWTDERKVYPVWTHTEGNKYTEKADFEMRFETYGGIYDPALILNCCCEDYGDSNLVFKVAMPVLDSEKYGAVGPVGDVGITIGQKKITIAKGEANPDKLSLKFSTSDGVVSGSFKLPYRTKDSRGNVISKTLSANFKGVVLIGWNDKCGDCGGTLLPFINGSWAFDDKVFYTYTSGKSEKTGTISLKRGGEIRAEAKKRVSE